MATQNGIKLKKLFAVLGSGIVVTSTHLNSIGISKDLIKYYLSSGWIESVGRGAYKKPGDKVEWQSALNALQTQTDVKVYVGGLSALTLQGYGHYVRTEKDLLYLFSPPGTRLPKWFTDYFQDINIVHKQTSFLPYNTGLKEMDTGKTKILVSTPEKAILECLYLVPGKIDIVECFHIFEGLVNLQPKLLNELLSQCDSVKVKRLFLYMAEKAGHQWFKFLKTDNISLGSGSRMIAENGIFDSKYLITVPKELFNL